MINIIIQQAKEQCFYLWIIFMIRYFARSLSQISTVFGSHSLEENLYHLRKNISMFILYQKRHPYIVCNLDLNGEYIYIWYSILGISAWSSLRKFVTSDFSDCLRGSYPTWWILVSFGQCLLVRISCWLVHLHYTGFRVLFLHQRREDLWHGSQHA